MTIVSVKVIPPKRQREAEEIRYRVDPRDVPANKVARRLHLTLAEFDKNKDELFRRGFPRPDPTTGHYDLAAVDRWMDGRHQTKADNLRDARDVVASRLAAE
jgi:hypothetical protein